MLGEYTLYIMAIDNPEYATAPICNMFSCLLRSIIIQNYSVHIYPQICQKNFCTRDCSRDSREI